jgi:hypothetical protein
MNKIFAEQEPEDDDNENEFQEYTYKIIEKKDKEKLEKSNLNRDSKLQIKQFIIDTFNKDEFINIVENGIETFSNLEEWNDALQDNKSREILKRGLFNNIDMFIEDVKKSTPDDRCINFSLFFTTDGQVYIMNDSNTDIIEDDLKIESFSFDEFMGMYLNNISYNSIDKNILCYHVIAMISKYGSSQVDIDSNAVKGCLENIFANLN